MLDCSTLALTSNRVQWRCDCVLQLKSVVFPARYTLDTLSEALAAIMGRKTYGKVVVDVQPALDTAGASKL